MVCRGDRARDARDWPRAARAYRAALWLYPHLSHIWVQYGHVLKEGGSPQRALAAYGRADRLRPGVADTHLQMGHAMRVQGDHAGAARHYDQAIALDPSLRDARIGRSLSRQAMGPVSSALPRRFRFVILGSTSVCNASCVHCPTGKPETAGVPRMPMPMSAYRLLLDEFDALRVPITGHIGFGLFGDALADPQIVERVRYARALFPTVRIVVNTNGAAFSARRHAALAEFDIELSLHCESLVPETYDHLMQPLRAARVFPRIEQILTTFRGAVHVSVPVSRMNLGELPAMRAWFTERGVRSIAFDPLSSRCAEDRSAFDRLALNPVRIRCPGSVLEDLIVDADGKVLVCCQDFQRAEPIGDLAQESLSDILVGPRREAVRRMLDGGEHDRLLTCSRCYGDSRGTTPA